MLAGPGGEIASGSAFAAGEPVLLQNIPIADSGGYTITVAGVNDTTGQYTVRAVLNASVEVETLGGPTNNDAASAQNLESSAVDLQEAFADLKATDRAAKDLEGVEYESPSAATVDVQERLAETEGETSASAELSGATMNRLQQRYCLICMIEALISSPVTIIQALDQCILPVIT